MIKKTLPLLILLSVSAVFSVDLQSLNLPQDARMLALSGAGIGNSANPVINPAGLSDVSERRIWFSINSWIADIKGSHFKLIWDQENPKMFTVQTWNLEDIELRGLIPSDEPDGTFESHWASAAVAAAYDFGEFPVGLVLRGNTGKLFNESYYGATLDIGTVHAFSDHFSLGAVIRNLGFVSSDSLRQSLPVQAGAGAGIQIPSLPLMTLADVVYTEEHELTIRTGMEYDLQMAVVRLGGAFSDGYKTLSAGFNLRLRHWEVGYGISFPEENALGTPQFFEFVYLF